MIALVLVRGLAVGLVAMGLALLPGDAQAVCGDGAIDGVEACDLGGNNGASGFCCSSICEFETAAVSCRADAGACDVAELCTGASDTCPVDAFETAGSTCGSPSDTVCDNPDACDGAGACASNFELASVECRADAGECDVAELCDGAGSCPSDGFELAGTTCGSPNNTICDNPDACDGAGACASNFELASVACRADAGVCDVAELCDGAGSCPVDAFEPNTTECRVDGGACDVAELCDGNGACPVDAFEVSGTSCGDASDTVCDDPDTCDGSGACESNFELATVECRADVDACDIAELCDGAGACPVDAFANAGTACGSASDTVCDDPDSCDGDGSCVPNFELATVECRPEAGDCDIAELCDGAGGACPEDVTVAADVSCRSVAGLCDLEEVCPGGDPECPVDAFRPDVYSCRPPVGGCDVAELCSGMDASCPVDAIAAEGTTCREQSGECDQAETCDGADTACPANFTIAIDFDDAAGAGNFGQGVPLTDQYEDLGVVWSGTGALLDETALNGVTDYSPPTFVGYSENQVMGTGDASDNVDTMDLTCTAESVSFSVGSESEGTFSASAFDGNGIPLDQLVVTMDTAMQVVTLEAGVGSRIAQIEYAGAGSTEIDGKPRFAIDDVVLLIPEPAQALGGLLALATLAGLARRGFRVR